MNKKKQAAEQKPTSQHSLTPYRIEGAAILDSTGREVAILSSYNDLTNGNAAFIVRAVNAHEALVKAAEMALAALPQAIDGSEPTSSPVHRLRAALKLARGEA